MEQSEKVKEQCIKLADLINDEDFKNRIAVLNNYREIKKRNYDYALTNLQKLEMKSPKFIYYYALVLYLMKKK